MNKKSKLIVALDFANPEQTLNFIQSFPKDVLRLKVGMELFYSGGMDLIRKIHDLGFDVFLDLKLHDIPNTITKTLVVLLKEDVWMTNIHALAGLEAMTAAAETQQKSSAKTKLIAVTLLTSHDKNDLTELNIFDKKSLQAKIINLSKAVKKSNLNGVVCSSFEVKKIKETCGDDFLCITPGIRLDSTKNADQKRVMTPKQAIDAGSDFLVIGRPITKAQNPLRVIDAILNDIS